MFSLGRFVLTAVLRLVSFQTYPIIFPFAKINFITLKVKRNSSYVGALLKVLYFKQGYSQATIVLP